MVQKSLFFDLDGTLLDVSERIYFIHCKALESIDKKSAYSKKGYIELKRAATPEKEINNTLNEEEYEAYENKRMQLIESKQALAKDTLFSGVLEVLEELSKEYVLVIATKRKNKQLALEQIKSLGLDKFCQEIIITQNKKDITKSKYFSKEAVFISDTSADVLIGQELGLHVIAVSSGMRNEQLLAQSKPNVLIGSVVEIKRS